MRLELALFVSSKRMAFCRIDASGKWYHMLVTDVPQMDAGKERYELEVYRITRDRGTDVRAGDSHAKASYPAAADRDKFFKKLGLSVDDGWEPEEDTKPT